MISNIVKTNTFNKSIRMITDNNEKQISELTKFENMFSDIKNINEGDKVGKYNDKYYIQQASLFQKFHRWWANENRTKTFNNLNDDFTQFFKLGDIIKSNSLFNKHTKNKLIELVKGIIPGLYNLKTTYKKSEKGSDGEKLSIKIDSIILTLIDFKNELSTNNSIPTFADFRLRALSF
jgi:hypothetical protein